MAKKEAETIKGGDKVLSTVNTIAGDVRYNVTKLFKNVCWVQIAEGHGEMVMHGGKTVEHRQVYKGVRLSILAKVVD